MIVYASAATVSLPVDSALTLESLSLNTYSSALNIVVSAVGFMKIAVELADDVNLIWSLQLSLQFVELFTCIVLVLLV